MQRRGAGREVPPEAAQRLLGAGLLTADGSAGLRLRHALYQRLLPEAP
jgi:hypothetical protein